LARKSARAVHHKNHDTSDGESAHPAKFAAILGPTLMGVTALLTDSRTSIRSLPLLFGGGMWLLSKVESKQLT